MGRERLFSNTFHSVWCKNSLTILVGGDVRKGGSVADKRTTISITGSVYQSS